MKIQLLALFSLGALALAPLPASANDPSPVPAEASRVRSAAQLDELLGPIALFPDPLVALILPAAANSSDVVLAARFRRNGGNPVDIDAKPWDQSVRALAHYPEVLDWLDDHLDWMIELGDVFAAQPADVMNAIQRLRSLARAAGTLTSTAEQRIEEEDGKIVIVPARSEMIYVPSYDPEVVYLQRSYVGYDPLITFGVGFAIGSWMSFDCDWWNHRLWIGDCYRPWHLGRGWRQPHYAPPVIVGHLPVWRPWGPPARFRAHARPPMMWSPGRFHPAPFPGPHGIAGAPRPHFDAREPGNRNDHIPARNIGDRREVGPRDGRTAGPDNHFRPDFGSHESRASERFDRPHEAVRPGVISDHRAQGTNLPSTGGRRPEVAGMPNHSVIPTDRPVTRPARIGDYTSHREQRPAAPSAPVSRGEHAFRPPTPSAPSSVARVPSAAPEIRHTPSAAPQMHQPSAPPVHVQSSAPAPVRESSAPASRGDSGNRGHSSHENER